MSLGRVTAVAGRIARQFLRDKRTLALLFVVPVFVLGMLGYLFGVQEDAGLVLGYRCLDTGDFPFEVDGRSDAAGVILDGLTKVAPDKIRFERVEGDPRAAALSGEYSAVLVLGESFSSGVLKGSFDAEIIVEGSNPAVASQASRAVEAALVGAMAGIRSAVMGGSGLKRPGLKTTYIYGSSELGALDSAAPALVAFFIFFLVFLLTCVSFLRERSSGTMERLAASPATGAEVALGYMAGFSLFALAQAAIVILFIVYVLGAQCAGPIVLALLVTFITAVVAVNLGIFCSAFAANELQAVQFIPIVIVPQALLCGLLWPRESMAPWLRTVADFMPMTWSTRAMTDIMIRGKGPLDLAVEIGALLAFALLAIVLAGFTLKMGER